MNERDKSRPGGGGGKFVYGDFDYTLPRPPALGEERIYGTVERGAPSFHLNRHKKSSSPVPKSTYDLDDKAQMSTPPCFTWAQSLHNLLQDPDGVKLFLQYLESEGPHHADTLRFWFACEGLKNHDQVDNIQKLVKLIYKTYFLKSALPINEELRKQIMKNMSSHQYLEPPITLFDEAQAQIEYLINNTTYPNFLKSDLYLQYLQSIENASSGSESSSSSSISNKNLGLLASGMGPLPTLHENLEFNLNPQPAFLLTPGSVSTGYHTPTVRLTKDILLRSQDRRAMDIRPRSETYASYIYRSNGPPVAYNSYNPVSRQDSEMQSLSSHSDARTESDNMSMNERTIDGKSLSRSHRSLEEKHVRQLAMRNKETNMNYSFIPRTQRPDLANQCIPMEEHAALLIQKLENLKREQETQELLNRRLKEGTSTSSLEGARDLETAMREKLQFQDDNDQDILDEHVSRVFSDHSLSISPGGMVSPNPSSPSRRRRRRRPDRDGFSTFSADSGNVHDFEGSAKSASGEDRFLRSALCRRSTTKKTPPDLTDSGVSVVSDSTSLVRDSRVATWLMEAERSGRSGTHSEMAVREGVNRKYGRKERSSSLERNSGPAQPFIADPSMPPLPHPNTDIQLEEIRRRLTEDDVRTKPKQRSSKYHPEIAPSSQSTLRKSMRGQRPTSEEVTTVVFSFCDEQFPYRTKIPGSQITLRQFKDYLPKKGNYRYFFKTVCEDLSNQVTNEEVSNDCEVLPLWEGKIMAQVKPID